MVAAAALLHDVGKACEAAGRVLPADLAATAPAWLPLGPNRAAALHASHSVALVVQDGGNLGGSDRAHLAALVGAHHATVADEEFAATLHLANALADGRDATDRRLELDGGVQGVLPALAALGRLIGERIAHAADLPATHLLCEAGSRGLVLLPDLPDVVAAVERLKAARLRSPAGSMDASGQWREDGWVVDGLELPAGTGR